MSKKLEQTQIDQLARDIQDRLRKNPGKHFIGGEFVASSSGETFATTNPATQEHLADVARGNAADIDRAVQAARKALQSKEWKMARPAVRAEWIRNLGDLIRKNALELSVLESLDQGKTIQEAYFADLPSTWDIFHYYAGWATKIHGETIPVPGPYLNYTQREPVGVCGQIVPWNYPILMAAWKLAPALACGNTVVLKPAEETPLTALRLAELVQEAGIPAGVVNVVTGFGPEAGAALVAHKGVDKVAFTGSTEVGRLIMKGAAESNLKRVSLELGGKSPQIVFADADLKAAAKAAFYGIFFNKGEVCTAGSRLYVEKPAYEGFLQELATMAKSMTMGSPLQLTTQLGSLVNADQVKRVLSFVEDGKASGARLLCGGKKGSSADTTKGNFVEPTIFADVSPESRLAKEEVFGPVLSAFSFETEGEVLERANQSSYGLAAGVWTSQVARAHRLASSLQAGTIWVNCYNAFDSASPFGGMKESGFGREMGQHALELYTNIKSVWVGLR